MASAGGMGEADDRAGRRETAGADRRPNVDREDTTAPEYRRHPPRPHLTRAEHGNPGRVLTAWERAGRPTVREAESSAGNKMPKKRKPVTPRTASPPPGKPGGRWTKVNRKPAASGRHLQPSPLDNWPDTGPGARALKRALTWAGEPLKTRSRNPGTEGQARHQW